MTDAKSAPTPNPDNIEKLKEELETRTAQKAEYIKESGYLSKFQILENQLRQDFLANYGLTARSLTGVSPARAKACIKFIKESKIDF